MVEPLVDQVQFIHVNLIELLAEVADRLPVSRVIVAIVGTRRATPYGLRVARQWGRQLSEAGIAVVSGLARGIDAAAHRGALAADGPTVLELPVAVDPPWEF